MSKTNAHETALLQLIFNATTYNNLAENDTTSPATNLYVSLHTASPGEAGDQTTSEATYTGYGRVAVARTSGGWTVSGNNVSNTAAVTFGQCTAGSEDLMFFGIGSDSSGVGNLYYYGVLGSIAGPAIFIDPTGDAVTVQNHGLSNDDRVCFLVGQGQALPTGITEGTVYHVVSAATDTFDVSLTQGGASVDYTGDGDAIAYQVVPLSVSNGITPEFAIGALDLYED